MTAAKLEKAFFFLTGWSVRHTPRERGTAGRHGGGEQTGRKTTTKKSGVVVDGRTKIEPFPPFQPLFVFFFLHRWNHIRTIRRGGSCA